MNNKLIYIFLLLITLFLGYYFQKNYCYSECNLPDHRENLSQQNLTKVEPNGFAFSSNGVGYVCNQNFNFESNAFSANMPAGDSVDRGISELSDFLDKNPKRKVKIIGHYLPNEKNNSAFPNLGYARANSVKNYLVSKGIPSNRMQLHGTETNQLDIHKNTIRGPINLDIIDANEPSNQTDWASIKESFNQNPLQLNFNSGEAEINLTGDQRKMISDLVGYLDNVKGSSITVVGHTDNLGARAANVRLGQERADFAKSYLVKNGIDSLRISTSSLGPDQPIADNSQEAGRAKNRRTVVILK